MEEKELIKKIKNSLRAKKSHAEILSALQKKGYKLAYASTLLEKAQRPRKIILTLSIILVLLSMLFAIIFFSTQTQKISFLDSFAQKITGNVVKTPQTQPQTKINQQESEKITEALLYSIVNSLNLQKYLHKHPLTGEHPIINLDLKDKFFYIDISKNPKVLQGKSKQADIELISTEAEFLKILKSENQKQAFKRSLAQNKTQTKILAGKLELFAKGYKTLYDDWSS